MSTGRLPGFAGDEIAFLLRLFVRETGIDGWAGGDNKGFLCDLPNRGSFSPDAAFYTGPENPDDMDFYPEPPVFAVEVRSKNDYGPAAERAIRDKISDYFRAGTLVVWDVDLQHEEVVAKYSAPDFRVPQTFRRGEIADAEPAVPGWRMMWRSCLGGDGNEKWQSSSHKTACRSFFVCTYRRDSFSSVFSCSGRVALPARDDFIFRFHLEFRCASYGYLAPFR